MALDFFIRLVAFLINLALYFYGLVQISSKIVFCFFYCFFIFVSNERMRNKDNPLQTLAYAW